MPDYSLPSDNGSNSGASGAPSGSQGAQDSHMVGAAPRTEAVVATPTGRPVDASLIPDNLDARQDRHERHSRRMHFLMGLALLVLALFLARAAYENWQLRKGEESLRDAVEDQGLKLSQVGDISAVLGEDFVKPGTVLTGPDGQQYICAPTKVAGTPTGGSSTPGQTGAAGQPGAAGTPGTAGTSGTGTGTSGQAGTTGATGTAGTAGATGPQGPAGPTGATGATGPQGPAGDVSTIDMDDTYNNFGSAAKSATVLIDGAEGQGNLLFNLSDTEDFIIQDAGTAFATFADSGQVTFNNQNAGFPSLVVEKTSGTLGAPAMRISQTTQADALEISQTQDGRAIDIVSSGADDHAINITSSGASLGSAINVNHSKDAPAVGIVQNGQFYALGIRVNSSDSEGIFIDQNGNAPSILIDDSGTAIDHTSIDVTYADSATTFNEAGAMRIFASSNSLSQPLSAGDIAPGLVQINTNSEKTDSFNFLAFNTNVDGVVDDVWRVDEDGETFADGAYSGGGADFAEYMQTTQTDLQPGELLTVDTARDQSVKRTTSTTDLPIGVISTKPAFVGNNPLQFSDEDQLKNNVLVALVGQVPLKVTDENGPIATGDLISASSQPGKGRKASFTSASIGIALTDARNGQVTVLLSPRSALAVQAVAGTPIESRDPVAVQPTPTNEGAKLKNIQEVLSTQIDAESLTVSGQTTLAGLTVTGHIEAGADTAGTLTVTKGQRTAHVTFATAYDSKPHVQLTPHSFVAYRLSEVTKEGFTVELKDAATEHVQFEWLVIGGRMEVAPDSAEPREPLQGRTSFLEPLRRLFRD